MSRPVPINVEELRAAIEGGHLALVYQPQVTPLGGEIVAVEALVRWVDPQRGVILPGHFIQLAEKSGLIRELGEWVLRHACAQGAQWPGIKLSVNVSPIQFREPGFVEVVEKIVSASGLPFDRLELEITESAYFDDIERAEIEIRQLRDLGIHLALDDFGTGYASLSYVRRLPLDKIKIDKSFVDDIGKADAAAIINSVVALSRALGLKVTAEGVETEQQQKFLQEAGCDYLQGYLFSKPVSAQAISEMLVENAVRVSRES